MKRLHSIAATAIIAATLGASTLPAQAETPRQVAEQILEATRTTNWGRAASLMHPAALKELRTLFDPILTLENETGATLRHQLFGFATLKEATQASDSTVYSQLMNAVMAQQAGMDDAVRSAKFHYIGTVEEGRDTAHVLGRMSMSVQSIPFSQIEVISVVRAGATWRGLLKGELKAMAAGMKAAMEGQR